jgi:hypothetical protein
MVLLGVWLIVYGVVMLVGVVPYSNVLLAVLALAAGVLILLGR